jgi:hypothetical protein
MALACAGCDRSFKTRAGLLSHLRASTECAKAEAPADPDPLEEVDLGAQLAAWVSTVHALYSAGRIDARHESAITHGAMLAHLLDRMPLSDTASKWHAELRQVRRELMGDDDDNDSGGPSAGEALASALAEFGRRVRDT